MLHEGHRQSRAIADSASGEGFKIDSNTDMKENYP